MRMVIGEDGLCFPATTFVQIASLVEGDDMEAKRDHKRHWAGKFFKDLKYVTLFESFIDAAETYFGWHLPL